MLPGQDAQNAPITAIAFVDEFPGRKDQYYNNWNRGEIHFTNGQKASNCLLRYHSRKDDLLWLRESDFKTGIVIKESIAAFKIITEAGDSLHFVQYGDTSGLQHHSIFLEVLAEGKLSFYCHRKVTYLKTSDDFVKRYQYYLRKDGLMHEVRFKKRAILTNFSEDEKKKLRQIMLENHLKFKNEYELAAGFEKFSEH